MGSVSERTIFITGLIVRLLLLYGAVVVDKHEGAFILRIDVALRTLVPGAEVAFGIVIGEGGLGGAFLCSSKRFY